MTWRSVPSGMYGRCGRNSECSTGRCTRPCPNGQMPAMARNKVDFPDPVRPVITVELPGVNVTAAFSSSFSPLGSSSVRSVTWTGPSAIGSRITPPAGRRAGHHDRTMERGESFDDGTPLRQRAVHVDEPGQRALHLRKRAGDAHQPAELDRAAEVTRRGHHDREYPGDLVVAIDQRIQPLGPGHDAPPIGDHIIKPLEEVAFLLMLAVVERDALHVLAEAHQRIAEIGLHPLLAETQARSTDGPPDGSSPVPITA